MAIAIDDDNVPFEKIHKQVYDEASSSMIPEDFTAISSRQPELMLHADEFKSILRYFKIKPGYNFIVRMFHSMGFNLVASTYAPSIISYFVIGCVLMFWLQRISIAPVYQITTLILMASPFLFTTARFSSPDMLCAALSFTGLFVLIEISAIPGLVILLLAITARPDAVIFNTLACLALHKSKKLNLKLTILSIAISVAASVIVINGPGIMKEYLFTSASYSNEWSFSEVISNYSRSLIAGFNSILSSLIILFTFIGGTTIYLIRGKGIAIKEDLWSLLIMASITTFIVRYLFHPDVEDRFLIGEYLVILMGLCMTLNESFFGEPSALGRLPRR